MFDSSVHFLLPDLGGRSADTDSTDALLDPTLHGTRDCHVTVHYGIDDTCLRLRTNQGSYSSDSLTT